MFVRPGVATRLKLTLSLGFACASGFASLLRKITNSKAKAAQAAELEGL
jgi:hypothetical protein